MTIKTKIIGLLTKTFLAFISLTIFCNLFLSGVYAAEEKYITIVNPVRISDYNKNPIESISNQYSIIKSYGFPATWLVTYDVLEDSKVLNKIKSFDSSQEIGIFLEVTPAFANKIGIKYNDSGSWHHANSVFLSGYSQKERAIFIDAVFEKFKENFGYYPTSVGSWWTDSYSLNYMQEKYAIQVNLVCADQYSTDGYQIWGQPWGVPYYPSINHPALPASSMDNKLDVINLQWAPRDPLNGYFSSLYSTQDYMVLPKAREIDYFELLLKIYLELNPIGQVTVGLESDLSPEGYKKEFASQMRVVNEYKKEGVNIVTFNAFNKRYKNLYPDLGPDYSFSVSDLEGGSRTGIWYVGKKYRLFAIRDDSSVKIMDLRIYNPEIKDPYWLSGNPFMNLNINIPAIIDGQQNPDDIWVLPVKATIVGQEESITITGNDIVLPSRLKAYPEIIEFDQKGNEVILKFKNNPDYYVGKVEKGYSVEAIHYFKSIKNIFKMIIGQGLSYLSKVNYVIPQGEVQGLMYLRSLPAGKVLVYDVECLQCRYSTSYKPMFTSNQRKYVHLYSGKKIVKNQNVFTENDRKLAKKELEKTNAKYIYLVKFEGYEEKIPFSPGDFNIKRIFLNENVEIWEVIK